MTKSNAPKIHVAVIGAGLSGLTCAQRLQDHGFDVTIFEKSRGKGGRMSTRRSDEGLYFDHGAQYFTVRDPIFQNHVEEWRLDGIVDVWDAEIGTLSNGTYEPKEEETLRYVGIPGMNNIGRHLAAELDVHLETLIAPPIRSGERWLIADEHEFVLDEFEYVITSAPAAQSAKLLQAAPELQRIAENVSMTGCWAVMVSFPQPLELSFDAAFVNDSPLSWISRNNSKPGRDEKPETWVLHASPEWSEEHLEDDKDELLPTLLNTFWQATGLEARQPQFQVAHRWRYALPSEPLTDRCLFDPELRIGACGDWCGGPRVEGAFLSGYDVSSRIIASVKAQSNTH
ncbi:MAG: FAD-dependent oxidoreductase [Planctomycetaceae bacterium]|nr:FAD-dependent oxidoreductase [bacterium]MDC0274327.1 FAD-dependent oxidoreductase [Planctomycetaceae bacterium]MDC0308452.1 FAD-dependent oxidoreductase [Planctomycetaceae bacterium]MDG2388554.1 FAD-dependent oxidoreductase [Planctomycetaceae bacterium]